MLNIRKNEAADFGPSVVFRQDGSMPRASVVHHVPGRMRLRSPALKGDFFAIEELRRHVAAIPGVSSVTANPSTGSFLLEYVPATLTPEDLVEALALRGLTTAAAPDADRAGNGWVDQLAGAIKSWAANALAERLAFSLIRLLA